MLSKSVPVSMVHLAAEFSKGNWLNRNVFFLLLRAVITLRNICVSRGYEILL